MKREAPTEREIADLIASAYEGWAEPDPRRLAAIEDRLLARARPRDRAKFVWWWLVGALVAGAASALWWAVDYDSAEGQKELGPAVISPSAAPSAVEPPARLGRPEAAESKSAVEPAPQQGPVIYRREQ